jgi:hypothetical protein
VPAFIAVGRRAVSFAIPVPGWSGFQPQCAFDAVALMIGD